MGAPNFHEIERKFLVRDLAEEELAAYPSRLHKQYYLAGCPGVRIRFDEDRFVLTIKGKGSLDRVEVEKNLTAAEFQALHSLCDRGLSKRRYRVGRWEIDFFMGPLAGLCLAEVELVAVDEPLPPFPLSCILTEVTEDPRYTNSALAWGKLPAEP